MWKRLVHPNIVPLLGATVAPFQLVSAWMVGGELSQYISIHRDVDRLGLVGFRRIALDEAFTPSPVV